MRVNDTYLRQGHVWPSESQGEDLPIYEMKPPYALNAWRKLRDEAEEEGRWEQVRYTPLAHSLLLQALNTEVVFSDSLPPAPLFPEDDALLERVFDGLQALEAIEEEKHLHPIARAKVVTRFITHHTEETT